MEINRKLCDKISLNLYFFRSHTKALDPSTPTLLTTTLLQSIVTHTINDSKGPCSSPILATSVAVLNQADSQQGMSGSSPHIPDRLLNILDNGA